MLQIPRVNLPRWGLKQLNLKYAPWQRERKFTPLGFETRLRAANLCRPARA